MEGIRIDLWKTVDYNYSGWSVKIVWLQHASVFWFYLGSSCTVYYVIDYTVMVQPNTVRFALSIFLWFMI